MTHRSRQSIMEAAAAWWTYYGQLYIHFALPENIVVRKVRNAETGDWDIDQSWLQFAPEAFMFKMPDRAGLMNHSNLAKPISLTILRRVYDFSD